LVWSEVNVIGANCYGYSGMTTDFQAAIDLISSCRVASTKLVTHRFPFDEIEQAFKVAADKRSGAVKVHVLQ
jgi:threonine dehydrogenase-like Zn-dependent dehydrogenase